MTNASCVRAAPHPSSRITRTAPARQARLRTISAHGACASTARAVEAATGAGEGGSPSGRRTTRNG